jgi:DNA repair protein RecO (recombination protein O)
MPLVETESLVLKSYNLAESDRIVVLLTREQGVVRAVAKGAKRLKSKFGSGLEPFSEVQATYFQKDNVELVSLQKADLITSNFAAASNPDFLQKFAYLADALITFSPPHDPNETLYRMVKACVDAAATDAEVLLSTGVYFELWLLRLAGFLPDWTRCDNCRRQFDDEELANLQANFHLMCDSCRRGPATQPFDGNMRAIAVAARRFSPAEFARLSASDHDHLAQMSGVLKRIIAAAIGKEVSGEVSLALKQ